jgi:energy-coupling factor transporter ATP-binding protein EcfA2/flagellar motility protein MotE (MotC chaperone)
MARLTKADIERSLLTGATITWKDANGKNCHLALSDAKERRLFAFLLENKVREPTGLSENFVNDLSNVYGRTDDPASATATSTSTASTGGPWRLQSIETEGFGGLNIWAGRTFQFDFDQESLLIEGPNGSGKSSLIAAILWALSGERPRDQSDSHAHEPKPVFESNDKLAGNWPPIACYPPTATDLKSPPRVRVQLTFRDPRSVDAKVERTLDNGKVTTNIDAGLEVPAVLLETGLQMPARLARIRFDEGGGRLPDAVQKLTGLDDLVAIGALTVGLCHKSREYLSFKTKELATSLKEFDQAIGEARAALATVTVALPAFTISHTDDDNGEMATFGKTMNERAAEFTKFVSNDLAAGLDLSSSSVQHQVISAIGAAQEDVKAGIEGLSLWKSVQSIAESLDEEAAARVSAAIATARSKGEEAVRVYEKNSQDTKFQLKAVAAQWHAKHKSGVVENCPLCDRDLKAVPYLAEELEALRSAGESAGRTISDNINAILVELKASLPPSINKFGSEILTLEPRAKLADDLRATFVTKDRYAKNLTKFCALVEAALSLSPINELPSAQVEADTSILKRLNESVAVCERLLGLATWFRAISAEWSRWWETIAVTGLSKDGDISLPKDDDSTAGEEQPESLSAHLLRLSDALAKAQPYRKAAESMRTAWKAGKLAAAIQRERKRREAIAESLAPLKNLAPLAESVAREAIDGLSDRIAELLKRIHLTEQLQFHDARLLRKEGLIVRGGFIPDLRIDATLVANTSWLRAVLWAFLFALREEAIEQIGNDPFPLLVFDDPQSTFDAQHRHRWAQYIASLQSGHSKAQVILTTYDELFLDLIKVDGVSGRQAMMVAAGPEIGHVGIFEGEYLDRKWLETTAFNTPQAGRDYIGKVREYVEALLRLMLRGEDAAVTSVVSGFVLGDCREKLRILNAKGIAPWNRPQFNKLLKALEKQSSAIKYMEISHHAGRVNLGMQEATDVEQHWRKDLRPALGNCFRTAREHHLLHGGLKALYAAPPSVVLPEGYQGSVRKIPLHILGRASALSDGRVADGRLDLDQFASSAYKNVVLGRHSAYRLTAPTLEPVARSGDMLLVKEAGEPPAKSLVIALSGDRILARRFEIAENNSDVAVLTAQSINPRQIAPPVIAHKASFTVHKIIGVIYEEKAWGTPAFSDVEVCECTGQALLQNLATKALGLVEVIGQSAEPYALDRQYIIVKNEITVEDAVKTLEGKPIIATDTGDNQYFKRFRVASSEQVVLESLDSGGDYGPVVLSLPGKGKNCLVRVWPVAGVLFELPS